MIQANREARNKKVLCAACELPTPVKSLVRGICPNCWSINLEPKQFKRLDNNMRDLEGMIEFK